MPRIPGTTHAQTIFLRTFRNNPTGPAPADWPSPAILRRWLRRPRFRQALHSVQDTLRFQADFHLATAATKAAQRFETQDSELSTLDLNRILRLSHVRQRFTPTHEQTAPPDADEQPENGAQAQDTVTQDLIHIDLRNAKGYWKNPRQFITSDTQAREKLNPLMEHFGYIPPLFDQPDFPPPTPQDSFYFKLLHDPHAVLWYMKSYSDRFPQDDRYQVLLREAHECIPHPNPWYPQFADQPDKRWRSPATCLTPAVSLPTTDAPTPSDPSVPPDRNEP
jgi:hypothetical protein